MTDIFPLNVMGCSARLHGFELGPLANSESEALRGMQLAGAADLVDGNVVGLRLAGTPMTRSDRWPVPEPWGS